MLVLSHFIEAARTSLLNNDSLYNLLKTELQVLKEYLDDILTKK